MAELLKLVNDYWAVISGACIGVTGLLVAFFVTRREHNQLDIRVSILESGSVVDDARRKKKRKRLAELLDLLDSKT